MEEEAEKKGFKVEDRRRFSPEGELKPEHRQEKPAEKAAAEPAADAAAKATQAGGAPTAAESAPGPHAGGAALEINFATFIVGLSTEALAALGEMPDPATGRSARDFGAAQQLIDIIGMLREKTRGNLDRDEESLIDAILFDLRMKYVELARPPGR
jgi:Domain of unknown function (DUF1844)